MRAGKPKIIVVLGPTSSGKSELAIRLAKKFNGEVISADSRQVYQGLNLASGKISKKEMKGVPHHLLGVASPKKTFTVSRYQKLAERAIKSVLKKEKLPIICGGSGLYIDALIYGYKLPVVPPNEKLRRKLAKQTKEELFNRLKEIDPRRADNIDRFNKRRLVRALEVALAAGRVPELKKHSPYQVLKIGLELPMARLKKQINRRIVSRIKKGMIKEIAYLRTKGLSWKRIDNFGLECRYISRYLRGLLTRQEMTETLEKKHCQYVKRQLTWFKKHQDVKWIKNKTEALKLVRDFIKNSG
jgi:tRNA dimethylallyltransferase